MKIIKNIFKKKQKQQTQEKKFESKVRKNSKDMSEKEKMDKGFDGKTFSINGIDYDF
jgi:hypothetical protein|tara:strand:+ start:158 stop:328 length:171 start_codon:yes stop_codon:yes gene_type:complete